ncbi:MAG: LytTR family DNA-binding domain-containing protein [Candidatus Pseudobacter hemicellulosilyticus]|uniref:LytTR family DNA-binding domain-containing protein n=1 Tax=Candidatus Pseudobacter hemicellulosilyticus TaxID=3121375 RepID=A0AAJ5WPT2_9BACT|nr:MAG: LytTR family DNA-binding domain-containing protein [Pseudobacter sp.]
MNGINESHTLSCLVIDDEPLAIKLLEDHISRVPFLKLQGTHSNPLDALLAFNQQPADLIFLDIQMPQLNGVQFMQLLQNRAQVIIISAHQEYAIEGFEHNVVDYLLKPVSFERFLRAVEKAFRQRFPSAGTPVPATPEAYPVTGGYIFIKVETKMVRVELDDILYVEGLKNYLSIYTRTQRIITLQAMKQLEEALPANRFIRVHKSYIVALDKINTIERQEIMIGDKIIPIGSTYADNFFKMLNRFKA